MQPAPGEERERLLDPVDRISEVLFGLIMAVTIVGSLSIASAGKAEVRTVLFAALGCNIAWGLVDAVMYVVRAVAERVRLWTLGRRCASRDAATGQADRGALPDHSVDRSTPTRSNAIRRASLALPLDDRPAAARSRLPRGCGHLRDGRDCDLSCRRPVSLPRRLPRAMLAARVMTLVMLCIAGASLGRYAGSSQALDHRRCHGGVRCTPDPGRHGLGWVAMLRTSSSRAVQRLARRTPRRASARPARHGLLLRDARRAGLRRRRRHARLPSPAPRGPLQLRGAQRGLGVRRLQVLGRRHGHLRDHADRRRAVRLGARRRPGRRGERGVGEFRRVRRGRVRERSAAARDELLLRVERARLDAGRVAARRLRGTAHPDRGHRPRAPARGFRAGHGRAPHVRRVLLQSRLRRALRDRIAWACSF